MGCPHWTLSSAGTVEVVRCPHCSPPPTNFFALVWGLCQDWRDLIAAIQYVKGAYKKDGERLFTKTCSDRTRANGFKLKEGSFRLNIRRKYFTMRVVRQWNRLPIEAVDTLSLEVFKVTLDRNLSNLI